jgi:hypothetical protein
MFYVYIDQDNKIKVTGPYETLAKCLLDCSHVIAVGTNPLPCETNEDIKRTIDMLSDLTIATLEAKQVTSIDQLGKLDSFLSGAAPQIAPLPKPTLDLIRVALAELIEMKLFQHGNVVCENTVFQHGNGMQLPLAELMDNAVWKWLQRTDKG